MSCFRAIPNRNTINKKPFDKIIQVVSFKKSFLSNIVYVVGSAYHISTFYLITIKLIIILIIFCQLVH